MKYALISLFLLLSSCTKHKPRVIDDPVFTPYINKYISFKKKPLNYIIHFEFDDLPRTILTATLGRCTIYSLSGKRRILIDEDRWEAADETERFQVISHELGHCDLNRDHYDIKKTNGDPISIMSTYSFSFTEDNINEYMLELFHPSKLAPCFKDQVCSYE